MAVDGSLGYLLSAAVDDALKPLQVLSSPYRLSSVVWQRQVRGFVG